MAADAEKTLEELHPMLNVPLNLSNLSETTDR